MATTSVMIEPAPARTINATASHDDVTTASAANGSPARTVAAMMPRSGRRLSAMRLVTATPAKPPMPRAAMSRPNPPRPVCKRLPATSRSPIVAPPKITFTTTTSSNGTAISADPTTVRTPSVNAVRNGSGAVSRRRSVPALAIVGTSASVPRAKKPAFTARAPAGVTQSRSRPPAAGPIIHDDVSIVVSRPLAGASSSAGTKDGMSAATAG